MKFFKLKPEVPGRLAPESIKAKKEKKHDFQEVHFIFENGPVADIVQSLGFHLVTSHLREKLERANLTGFEFRSCRTSKGEQFDIASPGYGELPAFSWLEITGEGGIDDFGITGGWTAVVSEKALEVLKSASLKDCRVMEYQEE